MEDRSRALFGSGLDVIAAGSRYSESRGVWPSSVGPKRWQLAVKRTFDLFAATLLLLALSPLLLLVAVLVLLSSTGPVLFKQERCGLRGRKFTMLKFRTMVVDQSRVLDPRQVSSSEALGILVKLRADPRVTPIGRFLRRTSIDELPQLINVICGDMSLVGPRPLLPFMLISDPDSLQPRSQMRPGITGLWQVKARSKNTSIREMIDFDLRYIREFSLWLDVRILVATIPTLLGTEGAC